MRTTIKTIFAAAVVTLFACNKEDVESTSNFPSDGVIRVTTNVKSPTTRAGVTSEDVNNLSINIENQENSKYNYYGFFKKPLDSWDCFSDIDGLTPLTMLWQNSTAKISVIAVSPAVELADFQLTKDYSIESDQSIEANFMKNDRLYYPNKIVDPSRDLIDGKLPIEFEHRFSKMNIAITLSEEFNTAPGTTTNPITSVKVNNISNDYKWLMYSDQLTLKGTLSSTTPLAGAYTPGEGATKAVANYEFILLPQTLKASFGVNIIINDKLYIWFPKEAFTVERGTQYFIRLTVKDVVSLKGISEKKWENGVGTNEETKNLF